MVQGYVINKQLFMRAVTRVKGSQCVLGLLDTVGLGELSPGSSCPCPRHCGQDHLLLVQHGAG